MRQVEVHADPLPAVAWVGAALLRVLAHGGESTAITLRPLGDHIVTGGSFICSPRRAIITLGVGQPYGRKPAVGYWNSTSPS